MRLIKYRAELDANCHNILVEESSYDYYDSDCLDNCVDFVGVLNDCYGLYRLAEEHVYMIALSIKKKPLGVFEISHGIVDTSFCNPREIFIRLLLSGASDFVLLHNHPSGDSTPSHKDIASTRRIKECADMIGINLIDHIIIAGATYCSMLKRGIL